MLPTGHIVAGYLTAFGLIKVIRPEFSQAEINQLYMWGMFWGFAPDLDVFYYFLKNKNFLVSGQEALKGSHRKYYSHAPILWLIAGLSVYFLAGSVYVKMVGLLIWLGSWSHFLLDSIDYGIMWLWPFSSKVYALRNREVKFVIQERNFFKHSFKFLQAYSKFWTFYFEILIILLGILVLVFSNN
jgi:membrane-bound metal-dependent hydrolase YbcI (DUF457 family)